jgi:hypothetical protein
MGRGGGWVEAGERQEVALLDIGFDLFGSYRWRGESGRGRWRCRAKVEERLVW